MSAKLRAVGKHVLVMPLSPSPQTGGGLWLAETYQQPGTQGVIISVGERVEPGIAEELKPGKIVMFSWINGREVEHDGKKCRLFDYEDLLGVAGSGEEAVREAVAA